MSARKLQQEIEKCFKQVDIGVEAFDSQYEKYDQSTNASQRDKLVDNIKKECKKLQRLRDQIKTWAAGNEVKDKGPLLEKRELIESKMEAFKAVEKEMKTKAFSKEGLSASAKLDPKERERGEMTEFLQDMVDALGRQVEAQEAEVETLQGSVKKSKKGSATTERVAELDTKIERHKWHQEKLELLMRAMANDAVEPEQVKSSEEDIRNYVENNQEVDFYEDEGIYDDFGLDEESEAFAVPREDKDDEPLELEPPVDVQPPEPPIAIEPPKAKKAVPEAPSQPAQGRRPSQPTIQLKSPLPALATIQTAPPVATTIPTPAMKPAPPPTKPPGETLKYASAAAAAAASDTAGIGIAPLPPPPTKTPAPATASPALAHVIAAEASIKSSATSSPALPSAQPVRAVAPSPQSIDRASAPSASAQRSPVPSSISGPSPAQSIAQLTQASTVDESIPSGPPSSGAALPRYDGLPRDHDSGFESDNAASPSKQHVGTGFSTLNGLTHRDAEDESIYHLPASLRELLDAYESVKLDAASTPATSPSNLHSFNTSYTQRPDTFDAEKPRHYKPATPSIYTPKHYPQEPLPIFDDPRLYSKVDTDALFYSFYYRQGTHQQYLAAKALKQQSWRFHKNYQTWFQRHEEPKMITEDYEQGTYRFFDYESTW